MTEPKTKVKERKPKSGKSKNYVFAVGRRKTAIARVRLFRGSGEMVINNMPMEKYFPGEAAKAIWSKPFIVTDSLGKYYATVKAKGGGKSAQLGAVVHGLARALDKENKESYHSLLRKAGLLTRDPRAKERRKPGQMGKARKKKQSPKR